jgi:putative NADPH-quinone reductase
MRALLVYAHPKLESYTAAVRSVIETGLAEHGAEVRVIDLYGENFDPVLRADGLDAYEDPVANKRGLEAHCEAVTWCDTLIFVYPTWWYGLPAILKGWLDRVLLPGVAFEMPTEAHPKIKPSLTHIERLGVFTTCGASWWFTRLIGAPGRRTLLRGVRFLCGRRCRTCFVAHYMMDSSDQGTRTVHLARVRKALDRLLKE